MKTNIIFGIFKSFFGRVLNFFPTTKNYILYYMPLRNEATIFGSKETICAYKSGPLKYLRSQSKFIISSLWNPFKDSVFWPNEWRRLMHNQEQQTCHLNGQGIAFFYLWWPWWGLLTITHAPRRPPIKTLRLAELLEKLSLNTSLGPVWHCCCFLVLLFLYKLVQFHVKIKVENRVRSRLCFSNFHHLLISESQKAFASQKPWRFIENDWKKHNGFIVWDLIQYTFFLGF